MPTECGKQGRTGISWFGVYGSADLNNMREDTLIGRFMETIFIYKLNVVVLV